VSAKLVFLGEFLKERRKEHYEWRSEKLHESSLRKQDFRTAVRRVRK